MEAALIVGILLAYLSKTDNHQFKRDIWIGTGLAIILSVLTAIAFQVFRGGFEGDDEKIFEGIIMILAAAVLAWMIIWMFSHSRTLKHVLELKTDTAISENRKFALVGIAFISVFREGIETVLFLQATITGEGVVANLTGAISGIVVALALAVFFFKGTVDLDLKKFFNFTSVILIVFAAGLFSHGVHEFQELGVFGGESSFWNKQLIDLSGVLNDKTNEFGALLRALFGYQDKPTVIELISYVFYWLVMGLTFLKINREFLTKQSATTA